VQRNSVGTTWGGGLVAGSFISIDDFFVAKPTDSVQKINSALAQGQNLIFTPGIYQLDRTIKVKRPDTVVLGLACIFHSPVRLYNPCRWWLFTS
jgi:hypothetical protein